MDSILAAKLIALPAAFFAGSYNFAFSQNAVPILYSQPNSVSTKVFAQVYYNGLNILAPVNVLGAAAFAYLAYRARDSSQRDFYTSGAVLMGAIGVWTAIVMKPGINRLIEISKDVSLQQKAGVSEEVSKLLKGWVIQNYVRGSFGLTAGLAGLYAALS